MEFFTGTATVVRAILGTLLVFFIPGFAWTLVFFKRLQTLERIALSFGMSIAFVTLSIIISNVVLKIRINALDSILIIILITIIPLAVYFKGKRVKQKSNSPSSNNANPSM